MNYFWVNYKTLNILGINVFFKFSSTSNKLFTFQSGTNCSLLIRNILCHTIFNLCCKFHGNWFHKLFLYSFKVRIMILITFFRRIKCQISFLKLISFLFYFVVSVIFGHNVWSITSFFTWVVNNFHIFLIIYYDNFLTYKRSERQNRKKLIIFMNNSIDVEYSIITPKPLLFYRLANPTNNHKVLYF